MAVRKYSELTPDQQGKILCSLIPPKRPPSAKEQVHEALLQSDCFMVIVDNFNRQITLNTLPCSYDTYLREMQEINTGRYA